ncbi:MAG: thiamine biosynthesis protein ThiF [Marinilabiliales bacterium]|nr:MAG: thiamine biosynthesis protein ThiF [Marinilabiliales bacterium]
MGIAGCGGLGSNCAVALARVGVGHLIIADFDVIVESNLNRQYFFMDQLGRKKVDALKENLLRINPEIKIDAVDIKLNAADIVRLFDKVDVLVEAFDRADMKQMLIEAMLENLPDIPLVSGIGMAGWGNSNTIKSEKYDNIYICGDGISEVSDNFPPLAPRVGIVSNMQANTVLEILMNKK